MQRDGVKGRTDPFQSLDTEYKMAGRLGDLIFNEQSEYKNGSTLVVTMHPI